MFNKLDRASTSDSRRRKSVAANCKKFKPMRGTQLWLFFSCGSTNSNVGAGASACVCMCAIDVSQQTLKFNIGNCVCSARMCSHSSLTHFVTR